MFSLLQLVENDAFPVLFDSMCRVFVDSDGVIVLYGLIVSPFWKSINWDVMSVVGGPENVTRAAAINSLSSGSLFCVVTCDTEFIVWLLLLL